MQLYEQVHEKFESMNMYGMMIVERVTPPASTMFVARDLHPAFQAFAEKTDNAIKLSELIFPRFLR